MDNVTNPVPKNQITSAFLLNEFANKAAEDPYARIHHHAGEIPPAPALSLSSGLSAALSGRDYTYTGDTAYMDKGVKVFPLIVLAVIVYLIWFK